MKSRKADIAFIFELVLSTIIFFIILVIIYAFDVGKLDLKVDAAVLTPDSEYQCQISLSNLMKTRVDDSMLDGANKNAPLFSQYIASEMKRVPSGELASSKAKASSVLSEVWGSIIPDKVEDGTKGAFVVGDTKNFGVIRGAGYRLIVSTPVKDRGVLFTAGASNFDKQFEDSKKLQMINCTTYIPAPEEFMFDDPTTADIVEGCFWQSEKAGPVVHGDPVTLKTPEGVGIGIEIRNAVVSADDEVVLDADDETEAKKIEAKQFGILPPTVAEGIEGTFVKVAPPTRDDLFFHEKSEFDQDAGNLIAPTTMQDTIGLDFISVPIYVRKGEIGPIHRYEIQVYEVHSESATPQGVEVLLQKSPEPDECAITARLYLPGNTRSKTGIQDFI